MQPFKVVIPARYGSQRLPGKPLLDIGGKPMIRLVYEQAMKSSADAVIIATDDQRVFDVVSGFDADVVMTKAEHPSGTDRLQEVAAIKGFSEDDIVVNVQGDEPLIPPEVIDQVASNLQDSGFPMATLSETIGSMEEVLDPNKVKVVSDRDGRALYFSRAAIPWDRDHFPASSETVSGNFWQRHLGIYAYRVGLLNAFVSWAPAELEDLEKLEQLRVLVNGVAIHVDRAIKTIPPGVDTQEDLERVRNYLISGDGQHG